MISSNLPSFLYGTAWKEERTEDLVTAALAAGFRAFDTANQRKHYYEEGVGNALKKAVAAGSVRRQDLFLQTKFTYEPGQDHRLPFDPKAPAEEQVRQSFASSLEHLGTDYLDSYLIHGPELRSGLTPFDWAVWREMEKFHSAGKVRSIGISNVSASQLALLVEKARVRPAYVQNRCYPGIHWDRETRELCRSLDIVYQGFNLIRDPLVHKSVAVAQVAKKYGRSVPQAIYRFAMHQGMLPMTGTTNPTHMREALAAKDMELTRDEVALIEALN